jgi:DNA-directed RNA polymerase specialized sigma24 family protein
VTNGHIDALRARKHEIDVEPPELAADSYIPELVELSQEYDALVETLDESDRVLLRMMIAGHTLPEIAEMFAISYSAAGVRVHRIRNKIKELWRKNDGR